MNLSENYRKSISRILLVLNYDLADTTNVDQLSYKIKQHNYAGKLSDNLWIILMQYAHKYVIQNKDCKDPKKNVSGLYRVNLKAPDFLLYYLYHPTKRKYKCNKNKKFFNVSIMLLFVLPNLN